MNMNDMVIVSVDDHICEPPDLFDRQLRAQARAKGVDTSLKSSGGARPDDGTQRPITSGDIVSMFQKHAAERNAAQA